ncbi:MAG: REP-associated tyrosine transposase [Fimbriimonas sp.]
MEAKKGRYSRTYLPHFNAAGRAQFVTWRLKDAVPTHVIQLWHEEAQLLPEGERKNRILGLIEIYCDAGHGDLILQLPRNGRVVQESIFYGHGKGDYLLHAWVVMPNHVHVLLTPAENRPLGDIVGTIKGVTAKRINRLMKRDGELWQADYFDRYIRDADHFERVRRYIEWNPVKAKLRQDPKLFQWSSANPDSRKRLEIVAAGEAPAGLMRAGGPRSLS